ncbi:MAG: MCE family protein [Marmoricola sp.]
MTGERPEATRRAATVMALVACVVLIVLAFHANNLPFVGASGRSYTASFTDTSGLRTGDPVQVAGVDVGSVKSMRIASNRVLVRFTVNEDIRLGTTTQVRIKIASLLGSKYLEVRPSGTGRLDSDSTIPSSRTQPAYDIVTAFGDLAKTEQQLDTATIAKALDTVSDTFAGASPEVRDSVRGLRRFAQVIASRDSEVRSLFAHARSATAVLNDNTDRIVSLVKATNALLGELANRERLIHNLLVHTRALSDELDGLVGDNQQTLNPALIQLDGVTKMLVSHQRDLRATIRNLDNYARVFTNVVGSGPWFDSFIPTVPLSPQVVKR